MGNQPLFFTQNGKLRFESLIEYKNLKTKVMLIYLIAGLLLIIIGIIAFRSILSLDGPKPCDDLRWRYNGTHYLIQRRLLFLFWINIHVISVVGKIEKLQFDTKHKAVRYVDVHNIRKRFNKRKLW